MKWLEGRVKCKQLQIVTHLMPITLINPGSPASSCQIVAVLSQQQQLSGCSLNVLHGSSFFLESGINCWPFVSGKLPCNASCLPGPAPAAKLHSATVYLPRFPPGCSVCARFPHFIYWQQLKEMLKSLFPLRVCGLVQPFPYLNVTAHWLCHRYLQRMLVRSNFKIQVLNISNLASHSTGFLISFDWGATAQRPITSLCEGDYCLSVLLNKSVSWSTMDQYTRTTWGEHNRLKSLICNFFFFLCALMSVLGDHPIDPIKKS